MSANEVFKQSLHDLILVGETVQSKFSEAVMAHDGSSGAMDEDSDL